MMMDTYNVRHAVRDVGAALGMPPVEVDEIAKASSRTSARCPPGDADRRAEAPALDKTNSPRSSTSLEKLDGLPRHIALHPCG